MATEKARQIAALAWCDKRNSHKEMDADLAEAMAEQIDRYIEALVFCSGSADFGPDGQARGGWEKLCAPLISV